MSLHGIEGAAADAQQTAGTKHNSLHAILGFQSRNFVRSEPLHPICFGMQPTCMSTRGCCCCQSNRNLELSLQGLPSLEIDPRSFTPPVVDHLRYATTLRIAYCKRSIDWRWERLGNKARICLYCNMTLTIAKKVL